MKHIEIDDEVFSALEERIAGFNDTPNLVLRRVFHLDKPKSQSPKTPVRIHVRRSSKGPTTNMKDLIAHGSLKEEQNLFFHDYKGKRINGLEAIIRGNQLEYDGEFLSLSALTKKLMQEQGYQGDSYRGPQFWYTSDGQSVKELWDEYLKLSHNN